MTDESIEVNGVRFSAREVESVTIVRNDRKISIDAPDEPTIKGFSRDGDKDTDK